MRSTDENQRGESSSSAKTIIKVSPKRRADLRSPSQSRTAWLIACLSLIASCGTGRAGLPTLQNYDGIVAHLTLHAGEAIVEWRFQHRPFALVDGVEAFVNGRPINEPPTYRPYPSSGDETKVLFLIDAGGLERAETIEEVVRAVGETTRSLGPEVRPFVGFYDRDYHSAALPLVEKTKLASAARQRPGRSDSRIWASLGQALRDWAPCDRDRCAIYVYTDGFDGDPENLSGVGETAVAKGVCVSFIVMPSQRVADLPGLTMLVQRTGGQMLPAASDVSWDIETHVMSGARVTLKLTDARRFFWERTALLDVSLRYGNRSIRLSSPIDAPVADAAQTLAYAWNGEARPVIVGVISAMLAFSALTIIKRAFRTSA